MRLIDVRWGQYRNTLDEIAALEKERDARARAFGMALYRRVADAGSGMIEVDESMRELARDLVHFDERLANVYRLKRFAEVALVEESNCDAHVNAADVIADGSDDLTFTCPNCLGPVSFSQTYCIYCGTSVEELIRYGAKDEALLAQGRGMAKLPLPDQAARFCECCGCGLEKQDLFCPNCGTRRASS